MTFEVHDPKGLIKEAYRIDGISAPECRSIFLDWALGVPEARDHTVAVRELLVKYADQPADHPMTQTLLAALKPPATPKRRGGRAARVK